MGVATAFTYDTADAESHFATWKLNRSVVVTMNREATGMSAGTCKLVKLKVIN